jgi:DsbC/DsbD-like thiol-disulfide interchange protein
MRVLGTWARLSLWTAAVVAVLASPAAAAPPASRHVQPELVADVESIAAGRPFQAGLHLRMDPEWHTYWKNPGDSGLPTRLTWKLPEGFQAGPIEWPYPEIFKQGPVTSYGYTGEVLLPVTITPPPTLAPGAPVTLSARADWLECRDICLPGRRELSLVLPVRSQAPRPSAPWGAAFASARARVPRAAAGWAFEARETPERIVLVVRPPRGQAEIHRATFFPDRGQVIDHASPQGWARATGSYRLEMTPAPNAARPLGALEGVLVAEGPGGTTAVHVDAKSAATPAKEKP